MMWIGKKQTGTVFWRGMKNSCTLFWRILAHGVIRAQKSVSCWHDSLFTRNSPYCARDFIYTCWPVKKRNRLGAKLHIDSMFCLCRVTNWRVCEWKVEREKERKTGKYEKHVTVHKASLSNVNIDINDVWVHPKRLTRTLRTQSKRIETITSE